MFARFTTASAMALAWLSSPALGQAWSDDFDSYPCGAAIDTVGAANCWESWSFGIGSSTVACAPPAPLARSLPNCLSNNPGSDPVVNFNCQAAHPTAGRWVFDAWVYNPSSYLGRTYWIMLDTYALGGPYSWAVQVYFDGTQSLVNCDCNNMNDPAGPPALIRDAWVPIRADIDLDLDTVDVFYDGVSLTAGAGYGWTGGVFGVGSGILEIQALDLFPDQPGNPQTTEMYYDDLSLHPVLPDLGTNDDTCIQLPNSNSAFATITLTGTGLAGGVLQATVAGGVPGQYGYFISGPNPGLYIVPPGSGGIICIGDPTYSYNSVPNMEVFQFDAGNVSQAVSGGGPSTLRTDGAGGGGGVPAVLAGESRAFQAWYRDVGGASGSSNFSQSKIVTFN